MFGAHEPCGVGIDAKATERSETHFPACAVTGWKVADGLPNLTFQFFP